MGIDPGLCFRPELQAQEVSLIVYFLMIS